MLPDRDLMGKLHIDAKTLSMFRRVRAAAIAEAKGMAKPRKGKIRVLGISGSARDRFDTAAEDSNSEALLEECLSHCRRMGAHTELVPLRKFRIEHCKACYSTTNTQCHFYCSCYPKGKNGDDMTNILYDKIIAADAIIIATPVNNFKISAPLADFLDRCISLDGSLGPANPDAPKDRELNIKHMKYIGLTADQKVPGSGMLRRFLGKTAGIIVTGHEAGASLSISNLYLALNQFGMIFPPFSSMYAMSSICNSTYEDKRIVLGKCFMDETKLLAENVMRCASMSRKVKPTEWVYDYTAD